MLLMGIQSSGFSGTSLAGAEIGNFNEAAGRHVRSSSGSLGFRPGKTLYLSVDFVSAAVDAGNHHADGIHCITAGAAQLGAAQLAIL